MVELNGVFILSFARACMNLKIVVGAEAEQLAAASPREAWYPVERFTDTLAKLDRRFPDFDPIKEQIGVEMMKLWYELGPGRAIVKRGVDFLTWALSPAPAGSARAGPGGAGPRSRLPAPRRHS